MVSVSIFNIYFFFFFFPLNCLAIRSGFDEGSPDGNDPLQLARTMASRGITLASFQLAMKFLVQDLLIFFLLVLCGLRTRFERVFSKSLICLDSNNWGFIALL